MLEQRVAELVRRIAQHGAQLAEIESGGASSGDVSLQPSGMGYAFRVAAPYTPLQLRRIIATLRAQAARDQQVLAAERQRERELQRQADVARSTHRILMQKREELRILLGASTGMVKVAVTPVLPRTRVAPRPVFTMAVAAVVAGIIGTLLAFAMEAVATSSPMASVVAATPDPVGRSGGR